MMKSNIKQLLPVFCAGIFVFNGCTKQTVKTDPAPAPSVTTAAEHAATQPAATAITLQQQAGTASGTSASASGHADPARPPQPAEPGSNGQTVLDKIYFDFDSATLSEAARATLAANFEKLKGKPQAALRIEGHCDERGSDEYNLALSEQRAQAAFNYLNALGMASERLSAVGFGEEKPADPGQGQEAWSKNRRDEFFISK